MKDSSEVRVKQIITPLLQFDIYVSLAESTSEEKNTKKQTNKSYFYKTTVESKNQQKPPCKEGKSYFCAGWDLHYFSITRR
jgi:hypothetical protein